LNNNTAFIFDLSWPIRIWQIYFKFCRNIFDFNNHTALIIDLSWSTRLRQIYFKVFRNIFYLNNHTASIIDLSWSTRLRQIQQIYFIWIITQLWFLISPDRPGCWKYILDGCWIITQLWFCHDWKEQISTNLSKWSHWSNLQPLYG
jgi:hypothetical protein